MSTKHSVLVFDSNQLVQTAYSSLLRRSGFDVITTGCADDIARLVQKQKPDTVVMSSIGLDDIKQRANVILTVGGPTAGMDKRNAELLGVLVVAAIELKQLITLIRVDRFGVFGFYV